MHAEDQIIAKLDQLDKLYIRGTPITNPQHFVFATELILAWPILRRLAAEALRYRDQHGATAD